MRSPKSRREFFGSDGSPLDLPPGTGNRADMSDFLLVDISNTFTKIAIARGGKIGRIHRLPTKKLKARDVVAVIGSAKLHGAVAASVVPDKNREIEGAYQWPICWIGPDIELGVGIDYPSPSGIGADRLANAAGCVAHYGAPAVVVDFGTAVTFDIISQSGNYIGGVIAPGLNAMTEYLHDRTALLPLITLREPRGVVGRSTREAMISGAVHGYRGLVREILQQITHEAFGGKRPRVIATGGDASLIAAGVPLFTDVDPTLTLRGLLVAAELNPGLLSGGGSAGSTRRPPTDGKRRGRRGAK